MKHQRGSIRFANADEAANGLAELGFAPAEIAAALAPSTAPGPSIADCPPGGHLPPLPISENELCQRIQEREKQIRKAEKAARDAAGFVTKLRWLQGKDLELLKNQSPYGTYEPKLTALRIDRRRASESVNISKLFPSETEAGKIPIKQAIKLTRKRFYDAYENCFATPPWLRKSIAHEYGFPGLDVCASHGMQFGEQFYAPEDNEAGAGAIAFDGLAQRWRDHCPVDRIVWCNSPYNKDELAKWVAKCHAESQTGLTVLQLIPIWAEDTFIVTHAEIRRPAVPTRQDGFGPKQTRKASMGRDYVTVAVAIWRPGQEITDTRIHPID